jgi:glycosyltransferase involved in cell wall biosynthesis
MLFNKSIAVIVPAYNEENQILKVLKNIPDYVDHIVVINDGSEDNTFGVVDSFIKSGNGDRSSPQTVLLNSKKNYGVGASIAKGYEWCLRNRVECSAVMAGDGQMEPSELKQLCIPVITGDIDYCKGNRMNHPDAFQIIPRVRYFGIKVLSFLTRIISGYSNIYDSQTGYTAISLNALKKISLNRIYKRYGMPNDLLVKLNIAGCSVKEIPVKPVYRIGEKSKMRILPLIPKLIILMCRLYFYRIWKKYIFSKSNVKKIYEY